MQCTVLNALTFTIRCSLNQSGYKYRNYKTNAIVKFTFIILFEMFSRFIDSILKRNAH